MKHQKKKTKKILENYTHTHNHTHTLKTNPKVEKKQNNCIGNTSTCDLRNDSGDLFQTRTSVDFCVCVRKLKTKYELTLL